jgi:Raf kinase inhibitor-like YbhB/YbcL family protein
MRNKHIVLSLFMLIAFLIGGESMALELNSSAFKDSEFIPKKYTCQGEDVSVPLEWRDVPAHTESFALICDDPDAPAKTWVHWVVYDIPPEKTSLEEGIAKEEILTDGSKQGLTDFGDIGYGGPCPPPGKAHRYVFKLYCLDSMLNLKPGLTKQELLEAISGHIIQQAQLTGLYRR